MPKHSSSTERRKTLADYIDSFGDTMVQACSQCSKNKRVCRVHLRSGKCSECLRRGSRCDIKVTRSEFDRLRASKEKLRAQLQEVFEAQEKAREALRVAQSKELRLRQQMELIDKKADEAIAVESRALDELDSGGPSLVTSGDETFDFAEVPLDSGLHFSLPTWQAIEGSYSWDPDFQLGTSAVPLDDPLASGVPLLASGDSPAGPSPG